MPSELFKDAIAETYDDVKAMLFSICVKHITPDRSLDDLMSEAHDVFMASYLNDWDPDKGTAFSTWLYRKVNYRMLDMRRKITEAPIDTTTLEFTVLSPEGLDIEEFLQDLSDDSRLVAWVVLNSSANLQAVINGDLTEKEARKIRQSIRERLLNRGWSQWRVTKAFQEITNTLTQRCLPCPS